MAGAAVALILVIALVIVPAISPQKAAPLGTLEVRVTDAKDKPVVTAINVTFDNITVHRAGDGDSEGEWIVVSENLNKTVDLLQLSGVGDLLGEDEIQAGHYTQIRVGVVKVVVTVDGVKRRLRWSQRRARKYPRGISSSCDPLKLRPTRPPWSSSTSTSAKTGRLSLPAASGYSSLPSSSTSPHPRNSRPRWPERQRYAVPT